MKKITKCKLCKQGLTYTIDSRPIKKLGGAIRRRRSCDWCMGRMTTYEISSEMMERFTDLIKLEQHFYAISSFATLPKEKLP